MAWLRSGSTTFPLLFITAATISSRAVTDAVKAGLAVYGAHRDRIAAARE